MFSYQSQIAMWVMGLNIAEENIAQTIMQLLLSCTSPIVYPLPTLSVVEYSHSTISMIDQKMLDQIKISHSSTI